MPRKMKSGELDFGLKITSMEVLAGQMRAIGPEDFHRYHPLPFLQLPKGFTLEESESGDPQPWELSTLSTNVEMKEKAAALEFSNQLVELAKTMRNDFGNRLAVGRTSNNDLIMRSRKISKLHAGFILPDGPGPLQLADMGSLNGTFVNTARLRKNEPTVLQSGDLIGFYRFVFKYLESSSIIQHIQANF